MGVLRAVPVESRQHARSEAHRDFHAVVVNHVDETTGTKRLRAEESDCLLYTSPSPRDATLSRMPSSA